ncbi:exonuclease domain-containing protein [Pseudoalteromonas sp. G4]|uniref:exonuclease domain-containing protein n=1 Tax=Pseudoalteromonas sp. G4 TaxID=2992761 RepID=UPI00237E5E56|nr:exonuclease domain-containing protein [Pseudoalteromonas sp. G4]MDE3272461.1 exonuclease domain-containing protein [Pseudoalteromonas sp. G4]
MTRLVAVDTETTGLNYKNGDRVVEIGLVEIVDGEITGKQYQSYFTPERKKVSNPAYEIHGLKTSFLRTQPKFKDRLDAIIEFIGDSELLFYNKAFDLGMLDNECELAGSDFRFSTEFKSTCVMLMVKAPMKRKSKLDLDDACRMYGIDLSRRTMHGAVLDAELAGRVYLAFKAADKPVLRVPRDPSQKRAQPEKFPLPRAYEGYQLNFCQNTRCANYGVPPKFPDPQNLGKKARSLENYVIGEPKNGLQLTCKQCKTSSKIVSNKGIVQEIKRLQSIYQLKVPSCPNTGLREDKRKGIPDGQKYETVVKKVRGVEKTFTKLKKPCPNQDKDILSHPDEYWLDGQNKKKLKNVKGLPKVSYPDANGRYHVPRDAASQRFKCKRCHSRITAALDPEKGQHNPQINYLLFNELVNKAPFNRIYAKHKINHRVIFDRIEFFYYQCLQFEQYLLAQNLHKLKNTHLSLSLDNMQFYANWSSRHDRRRTKLINTCTVDNHSGYVLGSKVNFDFTSDYMALAKEFKRIGEYEKPHHKRRYQQYNLPDENIYDDPDVKTPNKHLLLRQTYSVIAHLEMLKPFLNQVKSVDLYADSDVSFDFAVTKIFKEMINAKKMRACLTRKSTLQKGHTETQKDAVWVRQDKPLIKGRTLDLLLLTDYDQQFIEDAALQGVDSYFNAVKRSISMAERPIATSVNMNDEEKEAADAGTASASYQKWNLYGAYNPKYISMLLEIFRIYRNFTKTPRAKATPAQRLGLVDRVYDIHDILEFSIANEVLKLKKV